MLIESLKKELNEHQFVAATTRESSVLVLAGAGTGKTRTIIARAEYLINIGVKASNIQIVTFTRKSAREIVERIKRQVGERAQGVSASTFHTWCMSLIRRAPHIFGFKEFSVIDREDQLQLYKILCGFSKKQAFPTPAQLCDLYSYIRNACKNPADALIEKLSEYASQKDKIFTILKGYEEKKKQRKYLDYDDVLAIVAYRLSKDEAAVRWLSSNLKHLLVDEMQDTNPLQWKILSPLVDNVSLFCVGDDAQSIYGFRGADFRNVHSFSERIPNSITLKLEDNYRSTQEILDLSNWLIKQSPLQYKKALKASRGLGKLPILRDFPSNWEEGTWIAEDLLNRHSEGSKWSDHMVLVRSTYSARNLEGALISKNIPYRFIGGAKLLESAHVRDVLAALRIVVNFLDEIAWMRFLTLWSGFGDKSARSLIDVLMKASSLDDCINDLKKTNKLPVEAWETLSQVRNLQTSVSNAINSAVRTMSDCLSARYAKQDWDRRLKDFSLVEKVAERHSNILSFIEDYILDPVSESEIKAEAGGDDVITLITVHSAKGAECKCCYVIDVSPGTYPHTRSCGDDDAREEERRVLYVALTRAIDELILTRRHFSTFGSGNSQNENNFYLLNDLPANLVNHVVLDSTEFSSIEEGLGSAVDFGLSIFDSDQEANIGRHKTEDKATAEKEDHSSPRAHTFEGEGIEPEESDVEIENDGPDSLSHGEIAIKVRKIEEEYDCIEFSVKVEISNTGKPRSVGIDVKGMDEDGFEVESVYFDRWIPKESNYSVTTKVENFDLASFKKISTWKCDFI